MPPLFNLKSPRRPPESTLIFNCGTFFASRGNFEKIALKDAYGAETPRWKFLSRS